MTTQQKNTKTVLFTVAAMVLVLAFGLYFGVWHHQKQAVDIKSLKINGGTLLQPSKALPDFKLESSLGGSLTQENLQGHWSILFFGFSNCGYVCPTTMSALNKMYKTLATTLPSQDLPQVIMISVDPDRDSIARMKSYVQSFNPSFIGARAPMEAVTPLEQALGVVAVKMEASQNKNSNNYVVNHSAELFLVDKTGHVLAYFSYPPEVSSLVQDYTTIVTALS
jgi:protein SCO1/2